MRKITNIEGIIDDDCITSMKNRVVQQLKFNPSQDFFYKDVRVFGVTVRQQGRKLIIIMKIYDEDRRKEIISKSEEMINVLLAYVGHDDIDNVHIVDSKDVLDQISKYKTDDSKFIKDQEQDIIIETIDIITGEMIPVEFIMGLVKMDKNKNKNLGRKCQTKKQKKN